MKKLNYIFTVAFFGILIITAGCSSTKNINDQQITDSATLRNMINSQSFTFVAQYANPIGIRRRYLTSESDISISKDTIISYLPFFGRGYSAPLSPSDVDFNFTSTKFSYAVTPARKGWEISVKPKDQNYMQELFFRIFEDGSASLNITSINRSSLSYDGYIKARNLKKQQKSK